MGAEVQEFEDGLAVHGRTQLRGAMLDSYGDHRIAMALAVTALLPPQVIPRSRERSA